MKLVREAVTSSNIEAIAYDADLGILEVEFRERLGKRPVYHYQPVPMTFYARLRTPGASVGRVVDELKRLTSVRCTKVAYIVNGQRVPVE